MINLPTRLFATKTEIEAAKSGKDPELARKYIEALEEIAEAALEAWQHDEIDELPSEVYERLGVALGKVYQA